MPRLLLHVGLRKTGTTAIQAFAAGNRQELYNRGLWYPDYRPVSQISEDAHHAFAHSLAGEENRLTKSHSIALVRSWRERMGEDNNDLLISSESISRHVIMRQGGNWISGRRRYLEIIDEVFDSFEVVVVIVLRRQDQFVRSGYQQYINGGPLVSGRWIDSESHRALTPAQYREAIAGTTLRFLDNLILFEEIFGKPKVLIFDKLAHQGRIAKTFFEKLGVKTDGLIDPGKVRQSPSYQATLLKRALWPLVRSWKTNEMLNRFITSKLDNLPLRIWGISQNEDFWENNQTRLDFLDKYSEENTKIALRYFPKRDAPLFV